MNVVKFGIERDRYRREGAEGSIVYFNQKMFDIGSVQLLKLGAELREIVTGRGRKEAKAAPQANRVLGH